VRRLLNHAAASVLDRLDILGRTLRDDATAYLSDLLKTLGRSWRTFFFTPADPTPLGIIRIALGLLILWNLIAYGTDLGAFLGREGWGDPALVRAVLAERTPTAWSFWFWVPAGMERPVWVACLLVAALFTAGIWSRTSAVLTWVVVVSTARRALMTTYGLDQVVSALTFYLAVTGASGQALSLDRFLARRRALASEPAQWLPTSCRDIPPVLPTPTISANLGLRLIQLHFCLIYGMAGLAKLQGFAWWSGRATWMVIAAGEFRRRVDLTWLASFPMLLDLATHATVFVEITFPVLIWVRKLRPLLLVTMALMHLMIDLTLGLTEFGLAMIIGNVAFVSGPWLRHLVTRRDGRVPAAIEQGVPPAAAKTRPMAIVAVNGEGS
jgi:hypothetical protein